MISTFWMPFTHNCKTGIEKCLKICPGLSKMKNSINVWRHRLQSTFNLLKLSLNDIFLSLKIREQEAAFVRNSFSTALDESQDQFCDLRNDSYAHNAFQEIAISQFWWAMHESYPQICELTFRILLPFATTYLGESGSAALVPVHIKTKARNRRKVDDDIRLALSNTTPRISKSAVRLQSQLLTNRCKIEQWFKIIYL